MKKCKNQTLLSSYLSMEAIFSSGIMYDGIVKIKIVTINNKTIILIIAIINSP
jgi:hypothetical protein